MTQQTTVCASSWLAARLEALDRDIRAKLGNDPGAYSNLDILVEYARAMAAYLDDEQLFDIFAAELVGGAVVETSDLTS